MQMYTRVWKWLAEFPAGTEFTRREIQSHFGLSQGYTSRLILQFISRQLLTKDEGSHVYRRTDAFPQEPKTAGSLVPVICTGCGRRYCVSSGWARARKDTGLCRDCSRREVDKARG